MYAAGCGTRIFLVLRLAEQAEGAVSHVQVGLMDDLEGRVHGQHGHAELVGDITRMLDANNVAWQIGEMGRLDLGGGGTIAKYVANRGIPVLDIGVPVLSMHAPFEVIHKTDLYMAYRTFSLFDNAQ